MHKLTEKKLAEIQKDTGHVLAIEDLADIEELNLIAGKVSGVTTKGEARLLSQPFELCGVLFYPITVAKSLWFSEMCEAWELEGTQQESFLFWLLTVPNITGELDKYSDREPAHKAIKRLSRKLHCSSAEMTAIYERCVGVEMKGGDSDGARYGGLIECLLREYGGSPEQWLYQTPLPTIETLMNEYAARINAEIDQANKQPGGKAVAPVASDRLYALRDFRLKSNEIKDKWSQVDGEESC